MDIYQKKSYLKLYIVLTAIALLLLLGLYIYEIVKGTVGAGYVHDYSKNIVFGLFTGFVTGIIITLYDYHQILKKDLHLFLKATDDLIENENQLLFTRNYALCLSSLNGFRKDTKHVFIVHRLATNNKPIIAKINRIKELAESLKEPLEKIDKESFEILQRNEVKEELFTEVTTMLSENPSSPENKKKLLCLFNDMEIEKKRVQVLNESILTNASIANNILEAIKQANNEFYDEIQRTHKIIIL